MSEARQWLPYVEALQLSLQQPSLPAIGRSFHVRDMRIQTTSMRSLRLERRCSQVKGRRQFRTLLHDVRHEHGVGINTAPKAESPLETPPAPLRAGAERRW